MPCLFAISFVRELIRVFVSDLASGTICDTYVKCTRSAASSVASFTGKPVCPGTHWTAMSSRAVVHCLYFMRNSGAMGVVLLCTRKDVMASNSALESSTL